MAPEIRDENEEEIEVYKEVANLADELRLTVLELEKEGKIERNVLLEFIAPETIVFYRDTFSTFQISEKSAFQGKKSQKFSKIFKILKNFQKLSNF